MYCFDIQTLQFAKVARIVAFSLTFRSQRYCKKESIKRVVFHSNNAKRQSNENVLFSTKIPFVDPLEKC